MDIGIALSGIFPSTGNWHRHKSLSPLHILHAGATVHHRDFHCLFIHWSFMSTTQATPIRESENQRRSQGMRNGKNGICSFFDFGRCDCRKLLTAVGATGAS